MKRLLIVFTFSAVFAFLLACGGSNEPATAQQNKAQKADKTAVVEFTWYTDWNVGMEAAKKEKKPVLVDFYSDRCKFCVKMDKETFAAPEIKNRLKESWIGIKIDTEDRNKKATIGDKIMSHQELSQYFRVTGLPTYLFMDNEGKLVTPYPGYVPKERFGHILDYLKDELYKKDVDFNDYIKSRS